MKMVNYSVLYVTFTFRLGQRVRADRVILIGLENVCYLTLTLDVPNKLFPRGISNVLLIGWKNIQLISLATCNYLWSPSNDKPNILIPTENSKMCDQSSIPLCIIHHLHTGTSDHLMMWSSFGPSLVWTDWACNVRLLVTSLGRG